MEHSLTISDNKTSIAVFQDMSIKSNNLRSKRTPKKYVRQREGKAGQTWKYVNRIGCRKWLDDNYPGWSFEINPASVHQLGNFVHIAGTLTVYESESLLKRTFTCFGAKEAIVGKEGLSTHPYLKSAETDALKRCVADLGGFNDVYGDAELLSDEGMTSEEDLAWYFEFAFPYFQRKLTPAQLMSNIDKFRSGVITKNIILQNIPELRG